MRELSEHDHGFSICGSWAWCNGFRIWVSQDRTCPPRGKVRTLYHWTPKSINKELLLQEVVIIIKKERSLRNDSTKKEIKP